MSMVVLCGLAFPPSLGLPVKEGSSSLTPFNFPLGSSWNTAVTCQPSIVTVRDILGSQENSNGGATFAGGWNQSIPDKRSISPPCLVNSKSMLVEIHSVVLPVLSVADECGDSGYSPPIPTTYCDSTGNIEDRNDHTFDPNYNMISIHTEIDMNWKYNGVAYPNAPVGVTIDVQGFVYWDPGHTGDSWHSYSGWELHPLTAWRLSGQGQLLTGNYIFSPNAPIVNSNVYFTAAATGGTPPYTYRWIFGDSSSGTGSAFTHVYAAPGVYKASLNITDSASSTFHTSRNITVSLPAPLKADYQFLPLTPLAGTPITFSSLAAGGQPPYSYAWGLGDSAVASGTTFVHSYSAPGNYTVTQNVTDSAGSTATVSAIVDVLSSPPPPLLTQLAFTNPSGLDLSSKVSWEVWDGKIPVTNSSSYLLDTSKVYQLNIFYQNHQIESRVFGPQHIITTIVYMYPHLSAPNGYVAFNSTIGNFAIVEQSGLRLVFIAMSENGTTSPGFTILVKVPVSPTSVQKDGLTYPFTYEVSNQLVVIQTTTLSQWDIVFNSSQP